METVIRSWLGRRPLLAVCGCFCLGIIINQYFRIPFGISALPTALFLSLSLFVRRSKITIIFILLTVVGMGAAYSKHCWTFPAEHISRLPYLDRDEPIFVEGMVVSDVEPRPFFHGKKTVFSLEVSRIKSPRGTKEQKGVILVNIFRQEDIRYGDHLLLEGKLHRPFNFSKKSNFSYREYLYRKGITFILSVKKIGFVKVINRERGHWLKALSLRVKHQLSAVLRKFLPSQDAGMMQALLLGDRYDIPKDVYALFKISGVAHIIAISGFNIGIVAYGIFFVLKLFSMPRRGQYFLTILLLVFYAFLTGGEPPVVRATVMAVVLLMGFIVEREPEPLNTLAFAGLLILLMNPQNLFDVGFQLSFVSVLSIILFYPKFWGAFQRFLPEIKSPPVGSKNPSCREKMKMVKFWFIQYFLQSTALSLSAYLGVVVLIAYYFHLFTPIGILANSVVVPLSSLIIFLGMGLLAAGIILPFTAFIFAKAITILLHMMVVSVTWFLKLPGAYFELREISLPMSIFCYLLIGLFYLGMELLQRYRKSRRGILN